MTREIGLRAWFIPEFLPGLTMREIQGAIATSSRLSNWADVDDISSIVAAFVPYVLHASLEAEERCGMPTRSSPPVIRLVRLDDGEFLVKQADEGNRRNASLSFVYFVHREPKRFRGGAVHIRPENSDDEFIVEPEQNSIVFYPSASQIEVTRVQLPTRRVEASWLILHGWFPPQRETPAGS